MTIGWPRVPRPPVVQTRCTRRTMVAGQFEAPSPTRAAPGPRTWPLIGNVGVFRGLLPFLEQEWGRHGDVFRVQLGPNTTTVVTHPEAMQYVLLTKRENYVKGSV